MPPSAAIAGQIADYDKNRVTSTDAMNQALSQYGVPEIRNTVAGLRTTLANTQNAYNAVDPSVTGRTQGSLVTEAQRTKQVANERAPIAGQISDQGRALGDQTTALNDALGQATTLATNRVNDYNTGRKALQDQYDTSYTAEQNTAKAEAQRQAAAQAQANDDRSYALQAQKTNYDTSGGGKTVDPGAEFMKYISSQFKSAGKNPSRQTQDAWANAWFNQNGVPANARQVYWNMFNSSYKRTDDPTKDHLYKK